jgi:hypothetical protein
MTSRGQATAFDVRETLDEAVRQLSVNAGPIQDRVRASGEVILDRLSLTDFAFSEDRELFGQIQAAFADTSSSDAADGSRALTDQMPDATAEGIASNILDLRDTIMGRAIRHARMTTHPERHRRSRGRPARAGVVARSESADWWTASSVASLSQDIEGSTS